MLRTDGCETALSRCERRGEREIEERTWGECRGSSSSDWCGVVRGVVCRVVCGVGCGDVCVVCCVVLCPMWYVVCCASCGVVCGVANDDVCGSVVAVAVCIKRTSFACDRGETSD